ncbi:DUF2225 domain-containing protein [Candidatus Ozemobacteraceae bacterium]|nr:DUF2225 domain-containing protein [Candidatus Ozemobacteraceae bacterium]
MVLNDKLFFQKSITCPVCEKPFTRYTLRKTQFSIAKRDIDYRPIYVGQVNPRLFAVCVCPNCFYAGEDKYFCPRMSEDDLRRQEYFQSHKAQWEAQSRVRAASSGQQIWKDQAAEKLKALTPEDLAILRRISPLLQKSAATIIAKGKPYNELQKEGDLDAAIRAYELAAICYKARKANHRILGYTYLNGAWASRDASEQFTDEATRKPYKEFENAFLREAINFLTITNKSTSLEDAFMPDGTKIPKENMPESRIFEIMYILAGANRIVGNLEISNKFIEQLLFGSSGAQGVMLWFTNQARDMRNVGVGMASSSAAVAAEEETDEDEEGEEDEE